ncbi:MAG: SAM-dependent methyltransferase [Firmicutes bacterium HGW-Firmicutes-1]|jgi:ubiquinone/menaquinone biosynthesis C-methylase UbiE|nr:MAG: SAM-dependent methyltransferase [Firmicutes bacterium HGW-Firmicutes-1]
MDSTRYFEEVAEQWDTMRTNFFTEVVREKAYDVAKVEKGKIAADIGAGTGFITEGLLERGLKVIAVDLSDEMLQILKRKFNQYAQVVCLQGKSESLPIEDQSVDYSMANMYLHHVEDPLSAIKEMKRILKTGGKLVITDLDTHEFEFLRTEHYDRWMGFNREDIKRWFIEAGLKNISIDCVGGECCTTSIEGCEEAKISIFIAYGEA